MLEECGLKFKEINQGDLHETCLLKNVSSPTLLVDDVIIFGGETDSSEGACPINLPKKREFKLLLDGLM